MKRIKRELIIKEYQGRNAFGWFLLVWLAVMTTAFVFFIGLAKLYEIIFK